MKSYRDLEIYKTSKSLAVRVHSLSLQLPKFELYEDGGQMSTIYSVNELIPSFNGWRKTSTFNLPGNQQPANWYLI